MIVIKIGGAAGVDYSAVCTDAARLIEAGKQVVLVHGGSADATALGEDIGHPPRFVTSPSGFTSRYTDRRTLDIFAMAVNGGLNTRIVEQLRTLGVNAFGMSGLDGGLITAKRKGSIRIVENGKRKMLHDDYTGKIQHVDVSLLQTFLAAGYTPVISPMAVSQDGEALNTDADRMAAMIAAALKAQNLLLLTAVPGLMRSFPDESTLISDLSQRDLKVALEYAEGRMKKKVLGAQEALDGGAQQVIIADGRIEAPISNALSGNGTTIH
ncbi:MAG: [LysW]-aminoadipate kinase [Chloroflexi bacterium]|nr:MAG: [LysW]-aminoadipate kinase [Chloroflexota bacterium]MBL1193965.1 [LysW]-aminoadipate kinase [Chloroflexota bacterium]NOH11260.1 [LysW]-aminoadipate kinase [Chloroflexota bacterium]